MKNRSKRVNIQSGCRPYVVTAGCFFLLFFFCRMSISSAFYEGEGFAQSNDTLLMFVGEELDVLSIASRHEQKVWDAPAVAGVITRKQIQENRFFTLAEALSTLPGFYMERKEYGTEPYLRGLPNSVLFLYDDVPTGSDVTKTLHQIDEELSLSGIKKIEVIRGAGSVLWGADAFSGIVNCVPLTGKDINGVETGVFARMQKETLGCYLNVGKNTDIWDIYFSINGVSSENEDTVNVVKLWGEGMKPVSPAERFGSANADPFKSLEVVGSIDYKKTLTFSGRFSDYVKPYKITETNNEYSWIEERDVRSGHVKIKSNKMVFGKSVFRFSGVYSWLFPDFRVINNTLNQQEQTYFGEAIFDRSFFSESGLLTVGTSYRRKDVENARALESYIPDYIALENIDYTPKRRIGGYKTTLWSLFTQYNQSIGDFDFFAGVRFDNHDVFENHASHSCGMLWKPVEKWIFKLIYGTAYRTPFAFQILDSPSFSGWFYEEGNKPDLEKIRNASLQIAYKPLTIMQLSICGFRNSISNHSMEDKYAGLSFPNGQKTGGLEVELQFLPTKYFELSSNISFLFKEEVEQIQYQVAEGGIYIRPDGTVEISDSVILSKPNSIGPEKMANVMMTFRPREKISIAMRGNYNSSVKILTLDPDKNDWAIANQPEKWLCHINIFFKELWMGMDMGIAFKNIFDDAYQSPGVYQAINGAPFEVEVLLNKKF